MQGDYETNNEHIINLKLQRGVRLLRHAERFHPLLFGFRFEVSLWPFEKNHKLVLGVHHEDVCLCMCVSE